MTGTVRTATMGFLVVLGLLGLPFLLGPMTGLFGWGQMGTMGSWGHMGTMGGWGQVGTMGSWGHMGGTSWGLGWLFTLAIPLLLVAAIGYLVVVMLRTDDRERTADGALTELRAAYARGEIDDDEFENRRWRLRQGEE